MTKSDPSEMSSTDSPAENPYSPPATTQLEATTEIPSELVVERRKALTFFGGLWVALGALGGLLAVMRALNARGIRPGNYLGLEPGDVLVCVLLAGLGILLIAAGVGLQGHAPWAHKLATLSCLALGIALPCVGTALAGYLLYLLHSRGGTEALGVERFLKSSGEREGSPIARWNPAYVIFVGLFVLSLLGVLTDFLLRLLR